MTPAEIITLRAPELADANASRIPGLIELASGSVGRLFGVRRNEAIALKVLCMIANDRTSSIATVRAGGNKVKEGGLEIGFSNGGAGGSGDGANPAGASWCAELKALAKACGAGLPMNRMTRC